MLRKKRVTISDQAQAAIAAGVPGSTALAEHGEPVPDAAEETTEITAEGETGHAHGHQLPGTGQGRGQSR